MRCVPAGLFFAIVAAALAGGAQAGSAPLVPVQPNVVVRVNCVLAGTQSATSIVLANAGNVPMPAGTKVHWALDGIAYQGDYTLTASLPVGQTVVGFQFPAVFGNSLKGGVACRASVVQGRGP